MTTVSARVMLAELVAGNRDAVAMADLAHGKMRRKIPDLIEALTGHFDKHHALLVGGAAPSVAEDGAPPDGSDAGCPVRPRQAAARASSGGIDGPCTGKAREGVAPRRLCAS